MKSLIAAALAASLLFVSSAFAGPNSSNPLLSIFPGFQPGPYVGFRGGYSSSVDPVIGANAGLDFGFLRTELDYDRLGFRSSSSNIVTGNAIVQLPFGTIVPYVLAGAGGEWSNTQNSFVDTAKWASGSAVWNVGGGMRYNVNDIVEIDARYRMIQPLKAADLINHPFQVNNMRHVVTIGANVHF